MKIVKSLFKNTTVSISHKLAVRTSLSIAIAITTTTPANAQVGITSLDTTEQSGTFSSYNTQVADPCNGDYPSGCGSNIDMEFGVGATNDLNLSGFSVGTEDYSLIQLADSVAFRRIDNAAATGERQLVFFEYDTNNRIKSSYTNTMAEAMLGTIVNRGIDNAFSNTAGDVASNNIERIDYIISAGLAVPSASLDNIGFLVLERNGNDPFNIAAITSLDESGKPNGFGPLQSVAQSTWGKVGPQIQTAVMRREENEVAFRPSHLVGSQTISGVYVSISSLGINPGQEIYGYALFPNDISASSDLVNLSDFPTDTSGASGEGGLDLLVGGGIFMSDNLTTISGTLYEDSNDSNDLDGNEPKLPAGITVRLLDNSDNIVATATTDSNGNYQFIGVANSSYKIQVDTTDTDIPDGYTLGTPNDLAVTVSGSPVTGEDFGFDISSNTANSPPFVCDSSLYIVIGNTGNTPFAQLNRINRSTNPFTFDAIGTRVNNYNYNALAYNPVDNYLYAIVEGANSSSPFPEGTVLRIGADGVPVSLGIPQGDAINYDPNAGTFLADGTYVVGRQSNPIHTIDVTTTPPTSTLRGTVTGARFEDFAVNLYDTTPNRVYGIEDNTDKLVYFDVTNPGAGVTEAIPGGNTTLNHNHGSQFYDLFGNLLYRSASTNALYKVNPDGTDTLLANTPSGGSHDGASCFAVGLEKEVNTTDPVPAGEKVTYTYRIGNSSNQVMTGVTLTDDLRSVTDYSGSADNESSVPVNGTYTGVVNTPSGNVALSNSDQTLTISNITLAPQQITTITAEVTIPESATPDIYYNQATLTGLAPGFVTTVNSDYPTSELYEDPTPVEVTEPIANNPNVLLVKRITQINGNTTTNNGDDLSIYNQEDSNPYDDNKLDNPAPDPIDTDKWRDTTSDTSSTFLIGGINGGKVEPDDELEYTIYFLSAGDSEAQNVLVCDRVPGNVSFIPTSFNNQTAAAGGLQASDRGILWFKDGQQESLTNTQDGDAAQYFPPGVEPSSIYPKIQCDGANTSGAIVVNLSNLPNATAPGTPDTSYGYIRFRGRVK